MLMNPSPNDLIKMRTGGLFKPSQKKSKHQPPKLAVCKTVDVDIFNIQQ